MSRQLDIAPLRSLVAVADCGGFQRAATSLHLSQGAVSQHVRRLERVVGRPLMERHGRGSRFTDSGEQLLAQARRLLDLHDDTLRSLAVDPDETITIGSTEHAAAQLLPPLAAALETEPSGYRFRFRIDRGPRLREALSAGTVDLVLQLTATDPRARPVGDLDLTWYASPSWRCPPAKEPVPVVAFDKPCVLRSRALETLAAHGMPAVVGAEATQLAGVQAAVAAGTGVALMATLGHTPAGLVPRDDLPLAEPIGLSVCPRDGLSETFAERTAAALRPLLTPVAGRVRVS
ncbi:LysR family transcriptional regulator [Solicola gregarius]|uniref:LysR family transcriptional regulator n=1 Tax=Solicola gregarius TaxID=2908642 RepID=A0AA46TM11_9ACTN|nr:LysR family transcriptional regulator [Solicola gregarius]UYM07735.1 LysR family transcriptional regulator [Solicola gregarius]